MEFVLPALRLVLAVGREPLARSAALCSPEPCTGNRAPAVVAVGRGAPSPIAQVAERLQRFSKGDLLGAGFGQGAVLNFIRAHCIGDGSRPGSRHDRPVAVYRLRPGREENVKVLRKGGMGCHTGRRLAAFDKLCGKNT